MPMYLWSNQGIFMLSTCASRTIHIYWWFSDYYYIEKTTFPPSGELGTSSCQGKLSLHCWVFAWLNDCANGDEADVSFLQTQKHKVSIMSICTWPSHWPLPQRRLKSFHYETIVFSLIVPNNFIQHNSWTQNA